MKSMMILSSFARPQVVPKLYTKILLNTKKEMLKMWETEQFWGGTPTMED